MQVHDSKRKNLSIPIKLHSITISSVTPYISEVNSTSSFLKKKRMERGCAKEREGKRERMRWGRKGKGGRRKRRKRRRKTSSERKKEEKERKRKEKGKEKEREKEGEGKERRGENRKGDTKNVPPSDSCHSKVIRNQQNLYPKFLLLP